MSAKGVCAAVVVTALGLAGCVSPRPLSVWSPHASGSMRAYEVNGQRYQPRIYDHYDEQGLASWYSYPPHARRTADGDWYDARALTAAHKTLPLPCVVEVTNLENGRKVRVIVNDRGPFKAGRIIDLSRAAAERLGFVEEGTVPVRVRLIRDEADIDAPDQLASAAPTDPRTGLRGAEDIGLRGRL
ncbi:MAG TPA: septal ring lytic transglycosylase RlpA family protein [Caulobacteraceae bacterium]|nr:septal ring lytic transglycosylase RlpA family protein [Caulobacteraceae bacterium]